MKASSGIHPRLANVQWKNVNVGMFSGPRPSYGSYSLGPNSIGALRRTGA
jgi:hypothetical protein